VNTPVGEVAVTRPQPCYYCNLLVSRGEDGQVHSTHPADPDPWNCFAGPTGRHVLLASDLCTCGRHPHILRLTHTEECATVINREYRRLNETGERWTQLRARLICDIAAEQELGDSRSEGGMAGDEAWAAANQHWGRAKALRETLAWMDREHPGEDDGKTP
jgi:hypothetical protein